MFGKLTPIRLRPRPRIVKGLSEYSPYYFERKQKLVFDYYVVRKYDRLVAKEGMGRKEFKISYREIRLLESIVRYPSKKRLKLSSKLDGLRIQVSDDFSDDGKIVVVDDTDRRASNLIQEILDKVNAIKEMGKEPSQIQLGRNQEVLIKSSSHYIGLFCLHSAVPTVTRLFGVPIIWIHQQEDLVLVIEERDVYESHFRSM